jgi:hypothetical protein
MSQNNHSRSRLLAHWKGFLEILRKSYWTRRWVIREILVGTRVLFIYGANAVFHNSLAGTILALDEYLGKEYVSLATSEIVVNARSIGHLEAIDQAVIPTSPSSILTSSV